jgi:nucleoid-associated protein YgaU
MDYTQHHSEYMENGLMSPERFLRSCCILIIAVFLAVPGPIWADEVRLNPDHPERYTVVKGDTLWGIAARFLRSPWQWPKIWQNNEKIKNPHLIYPGDVIVLTMVNGQPMLSLLRKDTLPVIPATPAPGTPTETAMPADGNTVKLSPEVRSESLEAAIPTIPPNAIVPFLTRPLAVGENELEQAGYVTTGLDDRIALGNRSEFYARGLKADDQEYYQIFRPGKAIYHPDTGELLAYEALYLGDAKRLESGDPAKLVVTQVKQEILPRDRLLVAPKKAGLPYYYPHAPKTVVQGRIVSAINAVAEIGPYSVVGISLGQREGIEEGNVLRVMHHVDKQKDPLTRETYLLPDEESGLLLVFRTYEKVSYALIMTATRPVHIMDTVTTP